MPRTVRTSSLRGDRPVLGGRLAGRPLGHGLHGLDHAVLHQPAVEGAVHALEGDDLPHDAVPHLGPLEDDYPRVPDADPDRVPPAADGLRSPVVGHHRAERPCALHDARVLLLGDEVWVSPLLVEELEVGAVLVAEGPLRRLLALAPRRHREVPSGGDHAGHLPHVGGLVRHVLPRLAGPHEVERVVLKLHLERVHDHELDVADAALLRELVAALDLLRRERDADDLRVGEHRGELPRCAADAAADVEDALRRLRARPL
mmetsp:Transcript_31326/g.74448  ORF Transcript_31326/g.74448 Transcript_31326/m.74448 type:complete len:259 (+) Transcript_31326:145-921(+)